MITPADQIVDWRRGVDYIGVTVCFLVHDGKGNVLFQKRGQQARDERGKWDIGGGAVEFGEELTDAVRREIKEELCTEPLEVRFLTAGEAHRTNDGKPTHWVYLLHAALVDPSSVKIGEPHKIEAIGWYGADSLPEPMHSQFHKIVDIAKAERILL
ncbi:MAG: pyrophosphohydrolase [Candidatus Saccharibacteria bacterium]|nr:pyrophosphohydrolase [Candidatus Saccharibacteria bacterium]